MKKEKKAKKIFLGGTCGQSTWREDLIPLLNVPFFNPVVKEWNENCYKTELEERKNDALILYALTPEMEGIYSIAEVVDDSNKQPERTVLCILFNKEDTEAHLFKSLIALEKMVKANGAKVFHSLAEVSAYANTFLA